ncbi:SH3 domain-containing protein [Oryzibacter oryziterrae]|uniref:SH3 domain-containing protein n=1 Tax=Oryzibacter oryziterrae TaxID=2766474 RepID=UPI002101DABD|nr:SH3 domain-containing protein [Oryzibacter oryziterrae]
MFNTIWRVAAVALGLATVPVAAEAASQAWVTGNVNLRTGPSTQYYPIMVLPAGSQVQVYGCLQGYSWCDVSYYQERGWVSSRYLSLFYNDQQTYVPYRPRVTVPFLTFNFGYWDNYYVGRPWYTHRPPAYNPPIYRPPVYRPPVYRPPVYQGQPGNAMPPCGWDNDCPYTQQRPWSHNNSGGGGGGGGVVQGWGGPSGGGDVTAPPRPHKPRPEPQFDGGGVFGGSPGFSGGGAPFKPQRPSKPQGGGGGDDGVTQGGGGGGAVGIPGQQCVWKGGKCIGQAR